MHRTNNIVEGLHQRINSRIRQHNPRTIEFIKFLKEAVKYADFLTDRASMQLDGKRRK